MDMFTSMAERLEDQEDRILKLERALNLSQNRGNGAPQPQNRAGQTPKSETQNPFAKDNMLNSNNSDIMGSGEVDEELSKYAIAKLVGRGADQRCMSFWKEFPQHHGDLLPDLLDENLPPGRSNNRDESPFWMTRMKKHVEKVQMGVFLPGSNIEEAYQLLTNLPPINTDIEEQSRGRQLSFAPLKNIPPRRNALPQALAQRIVVGRSMTNMGANNSFIGRGPAPVQPLPLPPIDPLVVERCVFLLQSRGCDSRCVDYWKQNPEYLVDMVGELEDENMPPTKMPGRDQSPFWMTRLKKYIERVKNGGVLPPARKRSREVRR